MKIKVDIGKILRKLTHKKILNNARRMMVGKENVKFSNIIKVDWYTTKPLEGVIWYVNLIKYSSICFK